MNKKKRLRIKHWFCNCDSNYERHISETECFICGASVYDDEILNTIDDITDEFIGCETINSNINYIFVK